MKRWEIDTVFNLKAEFIRQPDGRWLASVAELPGVKVYGRTRKEARTAVQDLALRAIAERLETGGETIPAQSGALREKKAAL